VWVCFVIEVLRRRRKLVHRNRHLLLSFGLDVPDSIILISSSFLLVSAMARTHTACTTHTVHCSLFTIETERAYNARIPSLRNYHPFNGIIIFYRPLMEYWLVLWTGWTKNGNCRSVSHARKTPVPVVRWSSAAVVIYRNNNVQQKHSTLAILVDFDTKSNPRDL
jgi:hypothetical protein